MCRGCLTLTRNLLLVNSCSLPWATWGYKATAQGLNLKEPAGVKSSSLWFQNLICSASYLVRPCSPSGDFPLLLTCIPYVSKSLSCWATGSVIAVYSPFLLWRSQRYFLPLLGAMLSFLYFLILFIYLFLAVLGLCCVIAFLWLQGATL